MPTNPQETVVQFIASIIIALVLISFIVVIFQLYRRKKQVQEKELEAMKTAFENELLQTRIEIQEDVLKNVSMEIHDNIGQIMLLANVNISILQSFDLPPQAPSLIQETKLLISKAIEDISQLARSMHSDRITDMGVFEAITYELQLLDQKGLYQVRIDNGLSKEAKPLRKETQLVVFRMFQEVIKNIIKHAEATKIDYRVRQINKGFEMEIKDNGRGFVQGQTVMVSNGVGMRSLNTRVALFKGNLSINSILQEGTCVTIYIPSED